MPSPVVPTGDDDDDLKLTGPSASAEDEGNPDGRQALVRIKDSVDAERQGNAVTARINFAQDDVRKQVRVLVRDQVDEHGGVAKTLAGVSPLKALVDQYRPQMAQLKNADELGAELDAIMAEMDIDAEDQSRRSMVETYAIPRQALEALAQFTAVVDLATEALVKINSGKGNRYTRVQKLLEVLATKQKHGNTAAYFADAATKEKLWKLMITSTSAKETLDADRGRFEAGVLRDIVPGLIAAVAQDHGLEGVTKYEDIRQPELRALVSTAVQAHVAILNKMWTQTSDISTESLTAALGESITDEGEKNDILQAIANGGLKTLDIRGSTLNHITLVGEKGQVISLNAQSPKDEHMIDAQDLVAKGGNITVTVRRTEPMFEYLEQLPAGFKLVATLREKSKGNRSFFVEILGQDGPGVKIRVPEGQGDVPEAFKRVWDKGDKVYDTREGKEGRNKLMAVLEKLDPNFLFLQQDAPIPGLSGGTPPALTE